MPTQSRPTEAPLDALKSYAHRNGRTWKSKLLNGWMNGQCGGELQQLRNTLGPRWLEGFRLSREG